MSTLRADVVLSTGRTVAHRLNDNGAHVAFVKHDESSALNAAEWAELCNVYKGRSVIAPESDAGKRAADLGKAAGEKFAKGRIRMHAPVPRLAIAQTAGRSHMSAWDHGTVKGAADVLPYCEAFIEVVFALLEPAQLVTL